MLAINGAGDESPQAGVCLNPLSACYWTAEMCPQLRSDLTWHLSALIVTLHRTYRRSLLCLSGHSLPFLHFFNTTFVKLPLCTCSLMKASTHVANWGVGFFLQLLNATTLLEINRLNHELLHLPRKICVNQTVKAWVCFADCKTETNFAELQMMQIRQLQTERF